MSIKKVANIAGVSIATVSRFFNNPNQVSKQTREKVEEAIKRINYTPNTLAQNLRRGKTGLVIVVIPRISSPLYESIVKQLNQAAKANGYHLLVKEAGFNSLPLDYYQQMIRCKQADGFILLVGLADKDLSKIEKNLPIVLACEPYQFNGMEYPLPCMTIDYSLAAQEATEYLIHLEHKAIAFMARDHEPLTVSEQQSGYQSAMEENKLPVIGRFLNHEYDRLSIQEKLQKLLDTAPRPTAILCSDDDTAIELLHCIKTLGLRVPEDISVMGFNNVRYTEMTDPPLTTVHQPMIDIGDTAMNTLLALIDGDLPPNKDKEFNHKIIIRNSTSRATP
ncbi:MAG: LacI family DNA-binding transcriptional regulator [Cellvibrionaceae bacterium]